MLIKIGSDYVEEVESFGDEARDYIMGLLLELMLCYEGLEDKEKLYVFKNVLSRKKEQYKDLYGLLEKSKLSKMFSFQKDGYSKAGLGEPANLIIKNGDSDEK